MTGSALVVVPLGATEQHGPHLPVGTDYITVEFLALQAAAHASDEIPILVAPVLAYGSSDHHLPFGGTMSLDTETYYRVLCALLRSLAVDGFKRIFLLNGHGGNHEVMQLAARDTALKHDIHVGAASYWTLAWDALVEAGAATGARLPGHAGRFETSVMLALRQPMVSPELPSRPHMPDGARQPHSAWRSERHGLWQSFDGYTDSPVAADAMLGREYLDLLVDAVHRTFIEFYRSNGLLPESGPAQAKE